MTPFVLLPFLISASFSLSAREYLKDFGYIFDDFESEADALQIFQKKFNLPIDGELNEETVQLMNRKRCGVPDIDEGISVGVGDFKIYSTKWENNTITWEVENNLLLRIAAEKAFRIWESSANLKFVQVKKNGNISISFKKGSHHNMLYTNGNCSYPFADGVLAHSYFPKPGGTTEIHMNGNTSITWGVLFWVRIEGSLKGSLATLTPKLFYPVMPRLTAFFAGF